MVIECKICYNIKLQKSEHCRIMLMGRSVADDLRSSEGRHMEACVSSHV